MRRLMVKLVALETALVGWLAYWIFLVYSNNPEVAGGLESQLSKFPQLSFTTVDITVLVVISALSILLAIKFDRGLKPGIRLERAIQMLESLMKRNLMLEAQVAEMKMASVQGTFAEPEASNEPQLGSWERAFRTPIEAGPPLSSQSMRRGRGTSKDGGDNYPDAATLQRPQSTRFDSKPSQTVTPSKTAPDALLQKGRGSEEATFTGNKDDLSPAQVSTWKGTPTPQRDQATAPASSPAPRKSNVAMAQPNSRRQPYIPVPATRTVLPGSLAGISVTPTSRSRPMARSNQATGFAGGSESSERTLSAPKSLDASTDTASSASSSSAEVTRSIPTQDYESGAGTTNDDDPRASSNATGKSSASQKKRFPWEDE